MLNSAALSSEYSNTPLVAVTQRVDIITRPDGTIERRDALDQSWHTFLRAAGCIAVPLPNNLEVALELMRDLPIDGLVLTGGNDLAACGGDAPERDSVEFALIAKAREWTMPILGVCRGMQMIQCVFGAKLMPINGHVAARQQIIVNGELARVNSFHRWGTTDTPACLEAWACAGDGIVKAVRHRSEPIAGVMWHPERMRPFATRDLVLFESQLRLPHVAIT